MKKMVLRGDDPVGVLFRYPGVMVRVFYYSAQSWPKLCCPTGKQYNGVGRCTDTFWAFSHCERYFPEGCWTTSSACPTHSERLVDMDLALCPGKAGAHDPPGVSVSSAGGIFLRQTELACKHSSTFIIPGLITGKNFVKMWFRQTEVELFGCMAPPQLTSNGIFSVTRKTHVSKVPSDYPWPQQVSRYPRILVDYNLKVLVFSNSRSSTISTV